MRLDRCIRCEGVFVSLERMSELVERRELLEELRALLPRDTGGAGASGPMYVRCPVCATLMNRKQYASGAKVVIDVCRLHGLWFDAGELVRVLDFIARGGLDDARRRDRAREEEAERNDRLRTALEQARQPGSTWELKRRQRLWWLD